MADNFELLADELRKQMNELMVSSVQGPMQSAVQSIPAIMRREDWSMEAKVSAVQMLQVAIVSPFINAAVNAAHSSGMDLGLFLNYCGSAWDEIRAAHMAHVAADMLNPNKATDDD